MSRSIPSVASGASKSYVEQGWDSLTDEQLLGVQWFTDDPLSLPNVRSAIPHDLGDFQIELAYDLSSEDQPVACAHCPQHQKHRHGFVLRDGNGNRYLLGSTCGPKAYGTDYRMASSARTRQKRRYDALVRWGRCREDLPDLITALSDASTSEPVKVIRRARGAFERNAPRTVELLRGVRASGSKDDLQMSVATSERDLEAEDRVNEQFLAEVASLTDLQLGNREFNRRRQEIVERLRWGRQITITQMRHFGVLRGADWLRSESNPATLIADTVARLRGLHAIGRTTQDKKTPQLEKLSRHVGDELWAAENALRVICEAAEFFDPKHLASVTGWLNAHWDTSGTAALSDQKWQIREVGKQAVNVTIAFTCPRFEFINLRNINRY